MTTTDKMQVPQQQQQTLQIVNPTPKKEEVQTIDIKQILSKFTSGYSDKNVCLLRENGFKIKTTHYRYSPGDDEKVRQQKLICDEELLLPNHELRAEFELAASAGQFYNHIAAKGGKATVEVITPDGKTVFGVAVCSPKDAYVKRHGVNKAFGRMVASLCKMNDIAMPKDGKSTESEKLLASVL